MTLLLLFCVLYSAISGILDCNRSYIGIVNEKNEKEGFELYIRLPSTGPLCIDCKYNSPLKSSLRPNTFSPVLFEQDNRFTHLSTCKNSEYKQQDLLELHNTKEVTIGYFLLL